MQTLARLDEGITHDPNRRPAKPVSTIGFKLKVGAIIAAILGLGLLNVLTLVNDGVHAAAYGVIQAVAANKVVETIGRVISDKPMLANSTTTKRISDVKIATERLAAERTVLMAANRTLENRNSFLAKAQVALEQKQKVHIAAMKKISTKVAFRSIKNAARNFSSMVLEAVPYVGTGVMVAVTALDIDDACNNVRDLNEMNKVAGLPGEDSTKVCGIRVPSREEILAQVKLKGQNAYKAAADSIENLKK